MGQYCEVSYERLMSYAQRPGDILTQAFAGAVRTAFAQGDTPTNFFGLTESQFNCLLDRYFPGAWKDLFMVTPLEASAENVSFREDEIQDLVNLLLEHRANDRDETTWLAYAIATGCMGGNHLWQDMGLTGRQDITDLLRQNFTALFEKNIGSAMRWKKFLYKQLCDRAEVNLCKAPSCQVCEDYKKCFGTDDASGLTALSVASGRAAHEAEPESV